VITRLLLTIVLVASLAQTGAAQIARPASPMLEAAGAFLATLKPAQKAKAVLPFNSEERFHWFYTPAHAVGSDRGISGRATARYETEVSHSMSPRREHRSVGLRYWST
jgi:Protein of unknown function (DUF3500)